MTIFCKYQIILDIYALNYSTNKILWAKNFGVPFNTNILKKMIVHLAV